MLTGMIKDMQDLAETSCRFCDHTGLKMLMPFSSETSWRYNGLICLCFMMLSTVLWTASCATRKDLSANDSFGIESSREARVYSDCHDIEKHIRNEFRQWKGTRHRLGGSDHGGVDCSGFVRTVFKKVFNVEMPRTTKEQVKEGEPIGRDELQAGDLVFFKPPTYPCHVGIFLSGTEFVHASKSKGVTISQLDPHYWGKYYWTGRRVLPDASP